MNKIVISILALSATLFASNNAFATSTFNEVASGLSDSSLNVQGGTKPNIPNRNMAISQDNNGANLQDYQQNQSISCGGYTLTQGQDGVNIQSGGHVAITNPTQFLQSHQNLYYKVSTSSDQFYIQHDLIKSYNVGGCNFTLDTALAPIIKYQYAVRLVSGINYKGDYVGANAGKDTSANGSNTSEQYCPNTTSEITNKLTATQNGWYLIDSNSPNLTLNAGCAGKFEVKINYLINGLPTTYKTKSWIVPPSDLTPENPTPIPQTSTGSGDVWISE